MPSLKRTWYWTTPVLITASLSFAGAAFAATGSDYGSGSSSGSISRGHGVHGTNQSAGTPSETTPMSPECKSNPSSPKCTEEPHSPSGMSGSGSGSMGHGPGSMGNGSGSMSGSGSMGNGSGNMNSGPGSTSGNQPPAGGTSQMKPAVPEATTPAVRNGAAGSRNEAPNNISK